MIFRETPNDAYKALVPSYSCCFLVLHVGILPTDLQFLLQPEQA